MRSRRSLPPIDLPARPHHGAIPQKVKTAAALHRPQIPILLLDVASPSHVAAVPRPLNLCPAAGEAVVRELQQRSSRMRASAHVATTAAILDYLGPGSLLSPDALSPSALHRVHLPLPLWPPQPHQSASDLSIRAIQSRSQLPPVPRSRMYEVVPGCRRLHVAERSGVWVRPPGRHPLLVVCVLVWA
jgi:hypothetical protein